MRGRSSAGALFTCGEAYVLISGSSIVLVSGSIGVTPTDETDPAGTDHTVAAHVTAAGSPLAGQTVTFSVTGQNAGAAGTCVPSGCVTDANGDVSFTYNGSNGAGDDTIKASFTGAAGSIQAATAQEHWVRAAEQPIVVSGASGGGFEGSALSGIVATFTGDPAATPGSFAATIDWGDGSPAAPGTISGSGGAFAVSGSHVYAEEGTHTIHVVVASVATPTNTSAADGTATIADAPLAAGSGGTLSGSEGTPVAGTLATFSDGNASATAADFTATVDWGDGSSSAGTVSASGSGGFGVGGSHTYGDEGSYDVTVTTADAGGSSTVVHATATVGDAPIHLAGTTASATEGVAFGGTVATLTDGNTAASPGDFTVAITWGDGSASSPGTVTANGSGGFDVSGSHLYAEQGSHDVTVTATDRGGSNDTATSKVTVADAPLSTAGTTVSAVEGSTLSGTSRASPTPTRTERRPTTRPRSRGVTAPRPRRARSRRTAPAASTSQPLTPTRTRARTT